jgi:hypothetical protein
MPSAAATTRARAAVRPCVPRVPALLVLVLWTGPVLLAMSVPMRPVVSTVNAMRMTPVRMLLCPPIAPKSWVIAWVHFLLFLLPGQSRSRRDYAAGEMPRSPSQLSLAREAVKPAISSEAWAPCTASGGG